MLLSLLDFLQIRGLTSGVAVTMSYLGMTISAYSTNFMMESIGMGMTFLSYGVVCAVLAIFAILFLPETKDKTEEEKEAMFANKAHQGEKRRQKISAL